jgi:hypothetical protein
MKNHGKSIRNILLAVSLFLFLTAQSQSVKPNARLYQSFSKEYIENLLKTKPEQISYLNYFLDNSYYVVSLKSEKPIEGIDIQTLQNTLSKVKFSEINYDKNSFNILKYNFYFGEYSALTYIWKEAGIAIVLRPEKHIKEDFKLLNK